MSFRKNDVQQFSMFDSFNTLTPREQKALENSWAKVFAEEVFLAIDESWFSVLYSNKASRPNTPVNVIVGALLLKELFDLSDDEVVEDLLLDPRFQYALHTQALMSNRSAIKHSADSVQDAMTMSSFTASICTMIV